MSMDGKGEVKIMRSKMLHLNVLLDILLETKSEMDELKSKQSILIEKMKPYFYIYDEFTEKTILDKIAMVTKLLSTEIDFNINGELDIDNGHQYRIVNYGKGYAYDYSYRKNKYETPHYITPCDTLEEAKNLFIKDLLNGLMIIDEDGFYKRKNKH